jgi:hypothetical protein
MANKIINIQLSVPSGVRQPVDTSNRWTTGVNLAKTIRSGLVGGSLTGLSGSDSYLQVQTDVVCASNTAVLAAVALNDTISIGGTALTAKQKRATGTVTAASATAAQTVTVNGQVFTAVAGAATLGDATFSIDTGNTETATSLAAQINAYGGSLVNGIVKAKSSAAVVTLYAVTAGTAGNAISLASSDNGTLAVSGAVLANGAASANNEFDYVGTNATTADALAAAIIASTTAAVKLVTAASDGVDTVTVTAKEGGTAGNTIAFVSSNGTRIDVGGAGVLENGAASAVTRWSIG